MPTLSSMQCSTNMLFWLLLVPLPPPLLLLLSSPRQSSLLQMPSSLTASTRMPWLAIKIEPAAAAPAAEPAAEVAAVGRPPPSSTPKWTAPRVRRKEASVSSGSGPVRSPVTGSQHTTSHRAHGPATSKCSGPTWTAVHWSSANAVPPPPPPTSKLGRNRAMSTASTHRSRVVTGLLRCATDLLSGSTGLLSGGTRVVPANTGLLPRNGGG
mmetsp:Transcript_14791/g.44672  ORF Transcript_14791/g.44672 Transcript_14791/m.44672 type:complete len:211 (+) Transcript_14791:840-1472(+)